MVIIVGIVRNMGILIDGYEGGKVKKFIKIEGDK